MTWFSIFVALLVFLALRIARRKGSDLDPILWKWFVRLIWLVSFTVFQALELQRYLEGLSYRPFFGLYAGVLCAAVVWLLVNLLANVSRRHRSPTSH